MSFQKKSPIRFRNPMELNNSNAASAFFTFLPFYLFTFNHAPHADGDEGY